MPSTKLYSPALVGALKVIARVSDGPAPKTTPTSAGSVKPKVTELALSLFVIETVTGAPALTVNELGAKPPNLVTSNLITEAGKDSLVTAKVCCGAKAEAAETSVFVTSPAEVITLLSLVTELAPGTTTTESFKALF